MKKETTKNKALKRIASIILAGTMMMPATFAAETKTSRFKKPVIITATVLVGATTIGLLAKEAKKYYDVKKFEKNFKPAKNFKKAIEEAKSIADVKRIVKNIEYLLCDKEPLRANFICHKFNEIHGACANNDPALPQVKDYVYRLMVAKVNELGIELESESIDREPTQFEKNLSQAIEQISSFDEWSKLVANVKQQLIDKYGLSNTNYINNCFFTLEAFHAKSWKSSYNNDYQAFKAGFGRWIDLPRLIILCIRELNIDLNELNDITVFDQQTQD